MVQAIIIKNWGILLCSITNIIKAVEKAREKKMYVVGLLGGSEGKLKDKVDLVIIIPS